MDSNITKVWFYNIKTTKIIINAEKNMFILFFPLLYANKHLKKHKSWTFNLQNK
jgi:hypothetical protein